MVVGNVGHEIIVTLDNTADSFEPGPVLLVAVSPDRNTTKKFPMVIDSETPHVARYVTAAASDFDQVGNWLLSYEILEPSGREIQPSDQDVLVVEARR